MVLPALDGVAPAAPKPKAPAPATAQVAATSAPAPYDPSVLTSARDQLAKILSGTASPVTNPQQDFGDVAMAEQLGAFYDQQGIARPDAAQLPNKETAEQAVSDAERAQRRQAIGAPADGPALDLLGLGQETKVNVRRKTERMTQEEYDALSPQQRAAVDFNTMLAGAVRRDQKLQDKYEPTDNQLTSYHQSVENIFGADGGSATYAPETLAVLRQIDFQDDAGDLDDFLSLKSAIHAKDLKRITAATPVIDALEGTALEQPSDPAATPRDDRIALANDLAHDTMRMQSLLVKGNEMLATINQTAMAARKGDVATVLGGIGKDPKDVLGFGPAQNETGTTRDGYFQLTYNTMLADKDPSKVLGLLQKEHPEDYQPFLDYLDGQLTNAERYSIPLDDKGLTAEEFRKLLGGTHA